MLKFYPQSVNSATCGAAPKFSGKKRLMPFTSAPICSAAPTTTDFSALMVPIIRTMQWFIAVAAPPLSLTHKQENVSAHLGCSFCKCAFNGGKLKPLVPDNFCMLPRKGNLIALIAQNILAAILCIRHLLSFFLDRTAEVCIWTTEGNCIIRN